MVEYTLRLDTIFSSLADPVRRDIFERVAEFEQTVSDIASKYDMSLAAISKHLKVLEGAQLIRKRREGKQIMIAARTETLDDAMEFLEKYRTYHQKRYDVLEQVINERE